jgi:hypothetical protein
MTMQPIPNADLALKAVTAYCENREGMAPEERQVVLNAIRMMTETFYISHSGARPSDDTVSCRRCYKLGSKLDEFTDPRTGLCRECTFGPVKA